MRHGGRVADPFNWERSVSDRERGEFSSTWHGNIPGGSEEAITLNVFTARHTSALAEPMRRSISVSRPKR